MASEKHPSRDTLERFMRGDLQRDHAVEVLGHLLGDCQECRESTRASWSDLENGLSASRRDSTEAEYPEGAPYKESLDRAFASAIAYAEDRSREETKAPGLYSQLADQPQTKRLNLVRKSSRFQQPSFCDWLVDKSFSLRLSEPRLSIEIAELAVEVAEQLDVGLLGSTLRQEYRCRSLVYLANALRVASDLDGARVAIREAKRAFEDSNQDPLDRALLCRFEAHLMRTQRQFGQADQLQQQAIALYLESGEVTLAARLYIDRGVGALYSGSPEAAIELYSEATRLLADRDEPDLEAVIEHNMAHCLHDLDRFEEAALVLQRLRQKHGEPAQKLNRLRQDWLEGKIQFGLGELEQSERTFLLVRDGFSEAGIAYDVASVSIDLAGVYASQGRLEEMRQLGAEMFQLFEAQEIHREALAALMIFRQAAEVENASLSLVQAISSYLRRAQLDPSLRFRHSGHRR